MKKIMMFTMVSLLTIHVSLAQGVKEDKATTTEQIELPTDPKELNDAKAYLETMITSTKADLALEEKSLASLNANKAKLDATDPELKIALSEMEMMKKNIANFKTLLENHNKNLLLVNEAIAKLNN
jgi:hypothetical protein